MKQFYLIIGMLLCTTVANAQFIRTTTVIRNININFINRDSVNLPLSENFELIEDSCAQIIRYGHLNMEQRRFTGKFKDVSLANPQLILTEGYFNPQGLKEGPFTARFLSGKLQARGNFKSGAYDGKWEVFYDNDKPRLTFEANGKDIKIIDAWDEKGNKTIDNGNGNFRGAPSDLYWKGKLLNGKPDGSWKAINLNGTEEVTLLTENFKNGVFQKGSGMVGSYTDSSRIVLAPPDLLPFTKAEALQISLTACNGSPMLKKVTGAKYASGFTSFSTQIELLMPDAFKDVDIRKLLFRELAIDGEISTMGKVINLKPQTQSNDGFVRTLIRQLQKLPFLEPATVDGKPVAQKFNITFTFNDGMYRFNYKFLPIEAK